MNMHKVKTTHPLVIIAAVSVAVFSLVGSAAILGWIPNSRNTPAAAPETVSEAVSAHKLAAGTAVDVPKAEPRPAPVHRAAVQAPRQKPVQIAAVPVEAPVSMRSEPVAPKAESPMQVAQAEPAVEPARRQCHECGTIESVRGAEKPAETNGVGIGVGAVAGGVLGHQMGHGNGNTAMTVLGAIAGHQIEKKVRTVKKYHLTVHFEDGSTQQVVQSTPPAWRQGDKVKVVNGSLVSNG